MPSMSSNTVEIKVWVHKVFEPTDDGSKYYVYDSDAPHHFKYTALFFVEGGVKVVEAPTEELLIRAIRDEFLTDSKEGETIELNWQDVKYYERDLVVLKSSDV